MLGEARQSYFTQFTTANQENPWVLFDTINLIVSPPCHAQSCLLLQHFFETFFL